MLIGKALTHKESRNGATHATGMIWYGDGAKFDTAHSDYVSPKGQSIDPSRSTFRIPKRQVALLKPVERFFVASVTEHQRLRTPSKTPVTVRCADLRLPGRANMELS